MKSNIFIKMVLLFNMLLISCPFFVIILRKSPYLIPPIIVWNIFLQQSLRNTKHLPIKFTKNIFFSHNFMSKTTKSDTETT
jgi:hypothetical protein